MIVDTNFLSALVRERQPGQRGPAETFMAEHRRENLRTCIISVGELLVIFPTNAEGWAWFRRWRILPLHPGIADAAADVDRQLIRRGERLGENDNWIAGFARFYREPVLSRDEDFDRVEGLRRVAY